MNETKHTPGPYKLLVLRMQAHIHGSDGYIGISLPYITEQDQANAEFIVRACNCHEALVEALNQTCQIIDAVCATQGGFVTILNATGMSQLGYCAAMNEASAVLKTAQGE